MHVVGTHHVAIITSNLARLREFYCEVLGLRPAGAFEGQNIAFVDAGTTLIELVEEPGADGDRRRSGWNHLALEVQDVASTYAELSARGIPFDVPPEAFPPEGPKLQIAFLHDPDGNLIELVSRHG
jgi:catechol 2,3-dioxygenase-like lactoylglutathione lyase family enzyme